MGNPDIAEKRYRHLFNDAPILYVITEEQRGIPIIKDINKKFLDLLGYSREEVVGKSLADYYTPESVLELFEGGGFQRSLHGAFTKSERSLVARNGQIIHTLVESVSEKDIIRNCRVVRATYLDITERKLAEFEREKLQAQLQQSQKMESIGTLAGGIAHDFNNILSSIIGYTELALTDVEKGSLIEENLQEVRRGGNRATDLVRQILTFARQGEKGLCPIRVSLIANEALKLIRSSIPTSIQIEQNIVSESSIMGDATRIHQIFINLCTNAAQAMEDEGGVLTVNLRDVSFDAEFIGTQDTLKPGNYLELIVSDTGIGISPDVIQSIFEPYYTTKEPGQGTGMGLAMVHGIVKSHGGEIAVESEEGKGTVFRIFLPVTKRDAEAIEFKDEVLPVGSERILFVDDELPIAQMSRQVLERLGYTVTIRTSSQEALALFENKPDQFDLVITDMAMPQMTGDKFAVELMKIKSDIPVILLYRVQQENFR